MLIPPRSQPLAAPPGRIAACVAPLPSSAACVRRAAVAVGLALLLGADVVAAQRTVVVWSAPRPHRQRAGRLACDTGWSSLRELRTPTRQRLYVEAPLSVTNSVGTFLLGAPTFVWADTTTFIDETSVRHLGDVGVRLLDDSTAIPLPPLPIASKPYMPIAVARGAKLLVVWGTSADSAGSDVWHQDTLWEATLEAGRWSTPRPILAAREFRWHPSAGSFIADDSSLVLAFPFSDKTRFNSPRGVMVMMRSRDRWRARRIDVGDFGPVGVAVMRSAPDELLIAAAGSMQRDTVHLLNGVYTIRLSTRSPTAEPRFTIVRRFDRAHAEDPAVFRTARGEHFVWRQPGRLIAADDSLIEAISRDHGESWTVTSAVSLEGDTRGMAVASLGEGDAIAMARDIRRSVIRTLRRTREHWTLIPESFPDAKTTPMITVPSERTTVWFAQVRPSTAPDGLRHDAPVLVSASRPPRCEPPTAMPSRKRLRAPPRGKPTLR
jgi:hypothetical protein